MPPAFCATIFATRRKGRRLFLRLESREARLRRRELALQGRGSQSSAARSDVARSALRFQNVETPFRSLHAGDGGESLRHFARSFSQGGAMRSLAASGQTRPPRFVTRSAGRSIRRASRSFAPRRFCNCCLAISVDPAAEFWRCAVTLRSRARRIFRRSTTFCPAICRCRAKRRRDLQQYYLAQSHEDRPVSGRNYPEYFVSTPEGLLREDAQPRKTTSVTDGIPKITGNHSFFEYLYDMLDGKMEGMFLMGQNPAVGAPNSRLQRKALSKLKWLVVRDMVEVESANFWANRPRSSAVS